MFLVGSAGLTFIDSHRLCWIVSLDSVHCYSLLMILLQHRITRFVTVNKFLGRISTGEHDPSNEVLASVITACVQSHANLQSQ